LFLPPKEIPWNSQGIGKPLEYKDKNDLYTLYFLANRQTRIEKKAIRKSKIFFRRVGCKRGALIDEKNGDSGKSILPPTLLFLIEWREFPTGWMDKYENQKACLQAQL
jgi:hypothetical protein